MRTIKKYANRKLYDTENKKYISMKKLRELIQQGEEVTVVEHVTGKDITSQVVSQILANEKKDGKSGVSYKVLVDLLRNSSESLAQYARKSARRLSPGKKQPKNEKNGPEEKEDVSQGILGWIADKVEEQVMDLLSAMKLAPKSQVEALETELAHLSRRVSRLEMAVTRVNQDPESSAKSDPSSKNADA